jgi:hypothetical protein
MARKRAAVALNQIVSDRVCRIRWLPGSTVTSAVTPARDTHMIATGMSGREGAFVWCQVQCRVWQLRFQRF